MNVEHSRGSGGLEYIPDSNGLDEFDAETAALVPRYAERSVDPESLLLCTNDIGQIAPLPSRMDSNGLPLMAGHANLFAFVDADPRTHNEARPSAVGPRLVGIVLMAALSSAVLLIGTGAIPSSYAWRSAAPQTLETRRAVGVDMLALSPAPDLATPSIPSGYKVPVVYRKPYTTPAPPVVAAVDNGMDINTVRRAFESLRSQNLTFEHCDVRLASADRAVARCKGAPGDLPAWTMDLSRAGEQWRVVSLEASPAP
jgi:hypothetical protein